MVVGVTHTSGLSVRVLVVGEVKWKPVKPHPDLFREIRRTAVEAAGPEPCSKDQFVDID